MRDLGLHLAKEGEEKNITCYYLTQQSVIKIILNYDEIQLAAPRRTQQSFVIGEEKRYLDLKALKN